jgi:prepilin signal peptidase PulO-like enzyme (type II secretory pathway)
VIQAHCAFGRFKKALNSEAFHGWTVLAVHEVLEEAYALVEHELITTYGSFPRRREARLFPCTSAAPARE